MANRVNIPQFQGPQQVLRKIDPNAGDVLGFDANGKLTNINPSTLTITSDTLTTPVIAGGLTASGSGANDFSGSTGTFKTSSGANTLSGTTTATDTIVYSAVGKGPVLKQGANGLVGTFVANGSTPVTVSNTSVAISDAIVISLNTVGGTVGAVPAIKTITAATGFTVAATASDTSTYNYALIKNAA